ncbi:hypothetical protein GEV33_014604 [Tenebrio molitor]|uniref:RNA-directed DNA polymerase n=1 Tax=Tenebrio molitor TaxID=7067 RepID=A0A8J6H6G8_TENMO|nr:hypothetical protein GEV33_014605 [Tenebrio molitor]KAH0808187.1 hypothetical protein GEV33_014604 [Tenebrio molitor]
MSRRYHESDSDDDQPLIQRMERLDSPNGEPEHRAGGQGVAGIEIGAMLNTMNQLMQQNAQMLQIITNRSESNSRRGSSEETRVRHTQYQIMPDLTKSIGYYKGEAEIEDGTGWLDQIISMAELHLWPEEFRLETARSHLVGAAKNWYVAHRGDIKTWDDFVTKFSKTFGVSASLTDCWRAMEKRQQKNGESVSAYFHEKYKLCKKLNLSFSETKEQIITGLANRSIVQGLFAKFHVDSDDLLHDIMDFERLCSAGDRDRRDRERERGVKNRSENPGNPKRETKPSPSPSPSSQLQSAKTCFRCKEVGHFANSCPSRPQITCFTCKQPGHKSPECPQRRQPPVVQHVDSTNNTNLKYYKDAVVNGEVVKSYLDLGSTVCVMRDDLLPKLGLMCDWSDKREILGYGGSVTTTLGTTNVHLEIDGVGADVRVHVVPRETQKIPLLVGHPFSEQPHIKIIKTKDEIIVDEDTTTTVNSTSDRVVLWAKDASVIPNNFLGHVVVKTNKINTDLCVEGGLREIGSLVPRCVLKTDEIGEAVLPVLNISGKDVTVKEGGKMARGETCVEGTRRREVNTVPVVPSEVNTDLTAEEATPVIELINEYKDLVARNMKQIGCTNLTEMDIKLTDDRPVFYRPYRMSFSEREQVKDIVQELIAADIVEPSESPFASPILLVKKKTGDVRLCVDYRALNKKTEKQHYPLPRIDDQLDRLHGQLYYTSLDLSSGYYQVPMSTEAKSKTTFVTPDATYCFKRMSFGLANAPSVFQRLINVVLGSLRYDTALAYLDDIIIPSKDVNEGLVKLRKILDRFREANLTLRLDKCFFFMKNIDYLGFTISIDGITPGERKLKCVEKFPVPVDIHTTRSFLGLANYFRRFIKGYALITKPLTDLLRKGCSFHWGELEQQAFDLIKGKLIERPILCVYNPKAYTEVHTDASSVGLAAVLLQKQEDGSLRPISYYSRKTTPEEAGYHSYELECLAIVVALEKYRVYLLGIPFVIKTDCNSLKLLANKKELNPRIGRWFVKLSEFNYTLEYHKAQSNQVADSLSRNPVNQSEEVPITGLPILGIQINTDWDGDQAVLKKFVLYQGRVYKISNEGMWRLYVPDSLRFDIVSTAHRELSHLGPFIKTKNGNKYVIAAIDGYSKYSILKAVSDAGAAGAINFVKDIMMHYGKPNKIISDRGVAFTSESFEAFCNEYEIEHTKVAVATPRANGQVERLNSMILTCTATRTTDVEGTNWDENLFEVQWSINNSVHSVTKRTPFSLVHTYSSNSFLNNPLGDEIRNLNQGLGNTESSAESKVSVDTLLIKNRETMAKQFNKKRRPAVTFNTGDLVLVRTEVPATGQSRKLSPKYRGPYEIVKFIGNDRYLVQDIEDRLKLVSENVSENSISD